MRHRQEMRRSRTDPLMTSCSFLCTVTKFAGFIQLGGWFRPLGHMFDCGRSDLNWDQQLSFYG